MYTLCPECKTSRTITVDELRSLHGVVKCKNCSSLYDVLELLNEGELPSNNELTAYEAGNFSYSNNDDFLNLSPTGWRIGFGLCLIIFAVQFYYFEGYNSTQNATLRPWLKKASTALNSPLPIYKNLAEFSILHGSFESAANNKSYIFKTALTNQASFIQNPPSIKLTLIDFTGREFASRIFLPKDYIQHAITPIKPESSIEISLTIATPERSIGGYHFELI